MAIAWLQDRLLTYDSITLHNLGLITRIKNFPAPAHQLDGMGALVLYIYLVSKHVMVLVGTREFCLVGDLYGDLDAFSYSCCHWDDEVGASKILNINLISKQSTQILKKWMLRSNQAGKTF